MSRANHDTLHFEHETQQSIINLSFKDAKQYKQWPKPHILPLEPAWDQPSSWPHRTTVQTRLIIAITCTVITVPCASAGGHRANGQQSDKMIQNVSYHVRSCLCVCEYFVISCLCVCAMLCTSPLCWCKFGSSLAHSGATTCHGSGPFVKLSSYTSSLAMAVWTPLIAPDLNHSSVSHSLIHW